MNETRHFLGINERTLATLVIAIAASVIASLVGSTIVNQRFNDSQSRQQAAYRADQDRRQAQYRRQLEAKFNQALRISSAQNSFSINKSVCGFRGLAGGAYKSALKLREKYDTLPPLERAKNEATIKRLGTFLDSLVSVPPGFKCATLPKKPPTP